MPRPDKLEKALAWARYLFWADLARRQFDDYAEGKRLSNEWEDWWHFFALLSGWYGAEYVVIEGWRDAELHDQIIDGALVRWSDIVDLLRRYRNGVFHYQPNLIEPKVTPVPEEAERLMFWVHYLHNEFLRYWWSYVNEFPGSAEQQLEFRDSVLAIVGWIPDDILEARASSLWQSAAEADRATAGDEGAAADELRAKAADARVEASKLLATGRGQWRSFLLKQFDR